MDFLIFKPLLNDFIHKINCEGAILYKYIDQEFDYLTLLTITLSNKIKLKENLISLHLDKILYNNVIKTENIYINNNYLTENDHPEIKKIFSIPIKNKDQIIGILVFINKTENFELEDINHIDITQIKKSLIKEEKDKLTTLFFKKVTKFIVTSETKDYSIGQIKYELLKILSNICQCKYSYFSILKMKEKSNFYCFDDYTNLNEYNSDEENSYSQNEAKIWLSLNDELFIDKDLKEPIIDNEIKSIFILDNLKVTKNLFLYPLIYNNEHLGSILLGDRDTNFDNDFINFSKPFFTFITNFIWNKINTRTKEEEKLINFGTFLEFTQKLQIEYNEVEYLKKIVMEEILKITQCNFGFLTEFNHNEILILNCFKRNDHNFYSKFLENYPTGIKLKIDYNKDFYKEPFLNQKIWFSNNDSELQKCPISDNFKNSNLIHIPLIFNNQIVGSMGLVDRIENFNYTFIDNFSLYFPTCGSILWSKNIRLHNKELEQEKNRLLIETEAITEIRKQEKYYISQISHELKTPLNAILGFTQLLQQDASNLDEFLNYILQNGNALMELINTSLNLNRLDFFNTNLEPCDLFQTLSNCIKTNLLRNDYSLEYIPADLYNHKILINYDKKLLTILLNNLLSNANKYCDRGGHIYIQYRIEENKIWLSIENTGEMTLNTKNLFKPFNKGTGNTKGHGLGLSIVKKIQDLLEEEIVCKCENNLIKFQASFTVLETSIEIREKRQMKFLYLEDNKFNQLLMKNIIKNHKLNLLDNAHAFIELMKKEKYDFILLDWHLNEINGEDVVKLCKKENIDIPIIIITADTNPEVLRKFKEDNLYYFNKPINIKEFKDFFYEKYSIII